MSRKQLDVHRVREHAAELHVRHGLLEILRVAVDRGERRVVTLGLGNLEELGCVAQAAVDAAEGSNQEFERLALPAKLLGALVVAPHGRVFRELGNFAQAPLLGLEVKDTSAARRRALRRR